MNPLFTIMNALKYLQSNTPPEFRNQGRMDAMALLSGVYQEFEAEHRKDRPDCAPKWLREYEKNARLSRPMK